MSKTLRIPDIWLQSPGAQSDLERALAKTLSVSKKIYGVSWTGGASPALTRTDDAVGMVANAGVGANAVTNDFDNVPYFKKIKDVTDAYGNQFSRFPKVYIKKGGVAPACTWQISEYPRAGFYLPWCFWDFTNSRALPYIDIGKYKANLSGANKLESKTGTIPLINKNIVDFRGYAQSNGAGYQQMDVHVIDLLNTLYRIEFATIDPQTVMAGYMTGQYAATHVAVVAENAVNRIAIANAFAAGYEVGQTISIGTSQGGNQIFYGRTITGITAYDGANKAISFDGAAVNIAIGNMIYNTGAKSGMTDSVVAKSGSPVSNSSGKWPCKYRGVESPWLDMWQFVDGVNINERQAWVAQNAAGYASNVFAAPYAQVGYANGATDGYVTVMGKDASNPSIEFATTVGGGSTTYYADYYYSAAGQRIARVGGVWSGDRIAGPSVWSLNYSSGDADLVVGGRLVRKAL